MINHRFLVVTIWIFNPFNRHCHNSHCEHCEPSRYCRNTVRFSCIRVDKYSAVANACRGWYAIVGRLGLHGGSCAGGSFSDWVDIYRQWKLHFNMYATWCCRVIGWQWYVGQYGWCISHSHIFLSARYRDGS